MAWSAVREKSAYVAAKHGLVGLTKVGAIELANTGITVNAICPGWVLTPLVQAQIDRRAAEGGSIGRGGGACDADGEAADGASSRRPQGSAAWPCSCARTRRGP